MAAFYSTPHFVVEYKLELSQAGEVRAEARWKKSEWVEAASENG